MITKTNEIAFVYTYEEEKEKVKYDYSSSILSQSIVSNTSVNESLVRSIMSKTKPGSTLNDV